MLIKTCPEWGNFVVGLKYAIIIPDGGKYREYVELAAGWNILVETGIKLGIDLDKPERARKVGNEYIGS